MASRVMVIGLDCVPPALAYDRYEAVMPNLQALRQRGASGPLRSTRPPITVPAWASMTSGRDPGELGLYGFRNRTRDRSYELRLARSTDVPVKRIWDRASEAGKRVASLFVPLTSPPSPVRGTMVSCFLGGDGPWTFPRSAAAKLEQEFGAYHADVADFRRGDLGRIFDELDQMRAQHFAMARAVWKEQAPDLQMMVEMGPDRLHHAAWVHMDPAHRRHDARSPWVERARQYYAALDEELGRMVDAAGDALVLIASDHGARAALGGVAVNELLIEHGWLTLRERPTKPTPLREVVDWSRTRAWAEGGYYSRVFVNLKGREPQGVVPAGELESARRELDALFMGMPLGLRTEHGAGPSAQVDWPERIYCEVRGEPPDLMVYFDDLAWRALGTVGHAQALVTEDEGLDGANHAWDGIVALAGPEVHPQELRDASILDVAPTVLAALDLPHELPGRDLRAGQDTT